MNSFKAIIIGASFYSVGYAFSSGNTLICEKTQLCDPQYYGTLTPSFIEFKDEWQKETKELFEFFSENGGIVNGSLLPSHSEILLADFIKRHNIPMLLGSHTVRASEKDITLINNGGLQHLEAEKIIDLREEKRNKKQINVICTGKRVNLKNTEDFDVFSSNFPIENRYLLTFCAKAEIETNLFKMLITEYLANAFKDTEARILRMAYLPCFEDTLPGPFDEFDRGIRNGREAEK